MKAKQTIAASVTVAAVALAFWNRHCRQVQRRNIEFEGRCLREALETLESEGGPALS